MKISNGVSIYYSKDHGWTGSVKNPRTGKRKVFYGKKKSDVKEKIERFLETADLTDEKVASDSVEHFFMSWLEGLKNSIKPKSYDAKEYIIKNFIIPELRDIQVGQIEPKDIQAIINNATEKGYSYSVISKIYININQRFNLAVERRELPYSPVVGINLPKQNERLKSDIRWFSENELKSILIEAEKTYSNGRLIYKHGYAVRLLAYTGLRAGELLALKWSDVSFIDKKITVNKNIVTVIDREKGSGITRVVQNTPKTTSGNRVIPLSKNAEFALKEIKNRQPEGLDYIIATDSNRPVEIRNLARMFTKIQKKAGISNPGTLHSLRHTFATRLLEVGEDIKVVSKLLGHADISITYNTYIHVAEEQKVKAIERLDSI